MALSRSMLKGMGLTEEQVSAIVDAHTETVDALKEKLKAAQEGADRLEAVQKELNALKAKGGEDYKAKYDAEHAEFEAYKETVAKEKAETEKRSLYRELLRTAGVDAKRVDAILRVTDFGGITVTDGKLDNPEELTKTIQSDWGDFIGKTETRGAEVSTPPAGGQTALSKAEIYRKDDRGRYVLDTEARQKALTELHQAEA